MSRQPIQDLNPRHYKIMDMVLDGKPNKEIAADLNLTESTVSVIRRGPQFQHELSLRIARRKELIDNQAAGEGVHDETDTLLQQAAAEAAEKLINNLRDDSDKRLQRLCANDILDRTGHAKVSRQESVSAGVIAVLDPADIARIQETFIQVEQMEAERHGTAAAAAGSAGSRPTP